LGKLEIEPDCEKKRKTKEIIDAKHSSLSNCIEKSAKINGTANYGRCVDAYGRGSTKDIDEHQNTMVAKEIYEHWHGASIASVVAASCIANVQHIRMLNDYINAIVCSPPNNNVVGPYKPFEIRAHIRQWNSLDCWRYDCLEDLIGPPPDIRAWFQGVCLVEELADFAPDQEWWPH